jgi:hypothetical protein
MQPDRDNVIKDEPHRLESRAFVAKDAPGVQAAAAMAQHVSAFLEAGRFGYNGPEHDEDVEEEEEEEEYGAGAGAAAAAGVTVDDLTSHAAMRQHHPRRETALG